MRLLQQVPAIVSVSLLDETGTERVFVSRLRLNRTGRGVDMSADPAVIGARANKVWYGPVQYQQDAELVVVDSCDRRSLRQSQMMSLTQRTQLSTL